MEGDVMPNHCYFQMILLQLNPTQTKVKPYLKLNLPNLLLLLIVTIFPLCMTPDCRYSI